MTGRRVVAVAVAVLVVVVVVVVVVCDENAPPTEILKALGKRRPNPNRAFSGLSAERMRQTVGRERERG